MWEDYLKDIYYDPTNPASFSVSDKLYRYVRRAVKYVISKNNIRKWLQRQEAYSLQRPIRRKFARNKIVVTGIDDQWSANLMDMVKCSNYNRGYTFVLVVIDVFSKHLWLGLLRDKKGLIVSRALEDVVQEGRQPKRIHTDRGQELRAREVQRLFKQRNIQHLLTNNEIKAAVAERVLKTTKTRIYRYFTYEYVDRLQTLPTVITSSITRQSEYDEKWTGEIFTISYDGDEILGTFYQPELQQIDAKEDNLWKVEKILKTRGRGLNKEHYVKWLNWPNKCNSWVKASDVEHL
ncbi:uncharacterized protein LOC121369811 [Gigantopelta aegis]|uniref:uncharacterized protein LOC121369811 n=1 Tax=Gigantopelta aegis TaxID=1735272 RepID=UPI001B88A9FD|nr:uncharacterized protein LOC121369811 [Gigantopelta aegis]